MQTYCPRCRKEPPPGSADGFCRVHGVALADAGDLDRLGTEVAGYELEEILGRGGMATVYRGERAGRSAALKILHPGLYDGAEAAREILDAVAPVVGLSHPALASVWEAGFSHGVLFFRMDLLHLDLLHLDQQPLDLPGGSTLADHLDQGPLPRAAARALAARLASGLEVLHEAGVVHRDLKPENVWLPGEGSRSGDGISEARLLDLPDSAVARVLVARGTVQGIFGTPQYMAPEAVLGRPVDGRADLYALGVVLFEAVTGRRPFDGDDPAAVLARHVSADPPPPPEGLEDLLPRLLVRDPERRFPSARALRAHLRASGRA